jgi:hypothetical protein
MLALPSDFPQFSQLVLCVACSPAQTEDLLAKSACHIMPCCAMLCLVLMCRGPMHCLFCSPAQTEDLLAKSAANKALNDKKRAATSSANLARSR